MRKSLIALAASAVLFMACNENKEQPTGYQAPRTVLPENAIDSTAFLVANPVYYGVVVQSPDSTDSWMSESVAAVDERSIADLILEAVYAGKLQAYTYTTGEPLSIEAVREIEAIASNSRDNIAKLQFEEKWYLDTRKMQFVKKVESVMLAYVVDADEDRYRAGIMVKFPEAPNLKAVANNANPKADQQ